MARRIVPLTAARAAACGITLLAWTGAAQANINSTGDVTPDPNAAGSSTQLLVGYTGEGTLTVDGGSDIDISAFVLGVTATGDGLAVFSGHDTTLDVGDFITVATSGLGEMQVLSGADVYNRRGTIGANNGGNGLLIVDGKGSTWTSDTYLTVGNFSNGELRVTNGGLVDVDNASIGYHSTASGTVTIDGAGSVFSADAGIIVGRDGEALLKISNGGLVQAGYIFLQEFPTAASIVLDNGTIDTDSLYSSRAKISGTGVINTGGLLSDIDLTFDASHGLQQTIFVDSGDGEQVAINLDQSAAGGLGVGIGGSNTLSIRDGRQVQSSYGVIGHAESASSSAVIDGVDTRWDSTGVIRIAEYGHATLEITGGAQVTSSDSLMAINPGSIAVLNIDGAGSSLTTTNLFRFALEGQASMSITNGAQVSTREFHTNTLDGSDAQIVVSGVDSSLTVTDDFNLGYRGSATMQVTGGATVNNANVQVGNSYDRAAVMVQGAGSAWNNAGFYVQNGDIQILDGATLTSTDAVGRHSYGISGTVLIDGEGSSWTHSDTYLAIGNLSDSSIDITNGAAMTVNNAYTTIGRMPGRDTTVNVIGPGSRFDVEVLFISDGNATGILNILDGAQAVSSSTTHLGRGSGSTAQATVSGSGSSWAIGSLQVGKRFGYIGGDGTVRVLDGATLSVRNSLIVGHTSGLELGIDPTSPVLIDVGGNAAFDGTLTVTPNAGTTLNQGDVITLIKVGGWQTGTFANVGQGESLGMFGSFGLLLDYAGGDGNDLVAHAAFLGDTNLDGQVSLIDLDILGQNYGNAGGWAQGDFNGDGIVSLVDLDLLGQNYGSANPPLTQAQMLSYIGQSVPEPSSLALLFLSSLIAMRRRRN